MAVTRTNRYNGTVNASTSEGDKDGTAALSGSVTADNFLIVAVGTTTGTDTSGVHNAPTKNSGTATIGTPVSIGGTNQGAAFTVEVHAWRVPITGSGTLTLNITDTGPTFGFGVQIDEVSGHDATTPITGAVTSTATSNSTLGATPATDDVSYQFGNFDTDAGTGKGFTASGWALLDSVIGTTSDYVQMQAATRTGSTSTTVDWIDEDGTPAVYSQGFVGFIIKVGAAGPATSLPLLSRQARIAHLLRR